MDSDDDDDMADLFSFGSDAAEASDAPPHSTEGGSSAVSTPTNSTSQPTENTANKTLEETLLDDDDNFGMDDSFMKMLDEQPAANGTSTTADADVMNDQETQDILNWLEEDDTDADALLAAVADESVQKTQEKQQLQQAEAARQQKQEADPAPAPPPVVIPPTPTFASLKEALEFPEATKLQLLEQWETHLIQHKSLEDASLRPSLWSRIICGGKSVDSLASSSLADSFLAYVERHAQEGSDSSASSQELELWIRTESAKLAPRVVRTSPTVMTLNEAEEALQSILMYHYHSNNDQSSSSNNDTDQDKTTTETTTAVAVQHDPLLPPVVCALLSAGVPKAATPVLMSHLVPSCMPLLALNPEERLEASKQLHAQFYLLACYHLPMLVYHLDRYVPGWYWAHQQANEKENTNPESETNNTSDATYKGRHLKDQGVIPPSWLMTHLVGECGGTFLDPNRLLQLLDLVFTNENNSLRFFLVLAVLEQHSGTWLELTGDELMESLLQHMQDSSAMTMDEWHARAKAMRQATPDSVVDRLRTAEDEAVSQALKERQKKAEAALKARLEAEAAAHRLAQEQKAEEARMRLTRARLVAYYRRFNPTKEGNVDKIMETYRDNYEELDRKLKKKYGVGFNPAVNPNKQQKKKTMTETYNESMKKTIESMNEGIKMMSTISTTASRSRDNPLNDFEETDESRKKEHRVSVSVKVGETLPFVCMSREQANDIRRTCLQKDLPMPLRFYLVDCRSEETAVLQGRFPTAARLSPETLMDPEQLQQYEDSFETVRGTFHICVMGEGHSAIPALYNQKITPQLEEYMREDESRTNNAALFFVKRGFPFVSVLEGGFASAHAWLVREGAKKGFDVKSLLVDYNPDVSLFGQMEKLRFDQRATAAYKTQRALQNILDQSLASIVKGKMQLEGSLTAEVETATGSTSGAATATTKSGVQASQSQPTAAGLSSFFGRRQQVAAAETTPEQPGPEVKEATAPASAPGVATNQNRFSRWKQAAASAINASDESAQQSAPQSKDQPAGPGRFGGFGFGNANVAAKRNPFARFGGGAAKANTPVAQTANGTNANAGFGGLMKMARSTSVDASSGSAAAGTQNKSTTTMARSTSVDAAPTIVALPPKEPKKDDDKEKTGAPTATIKAV